MGIRVNIKKEGSYNLLRSSFCSSVCESSLLVFQFFVLLVRSLLFLEFIEKQKEMILKKNGSSSNLTQKDAQRTGKMTAKSLNLWAMFWLDSTTEAFCRGPRPARSDVGISPIKQVYVSPERLIRFILNTTHLSHVVSAAGRTCRRQSVCSHERRDMRRCQSAA